MQEISLEFTQGFFSLSLSSISLSYSFTSYIDPRRMRSRRFALAYKEKGKRRREQIERKDRALTADRQRGELFLPPSVSSASSSSSSSSSSSVTFAGVCCVVLFSSSFHSIYPLF